MKNFRLNSESVWWLVLIAITIILVFSFTSCGIKDGKLNPIDYSLTDDDGELLEDSIIFNAL